MINLQVNQNKATNEENQQNPLKIKRKFLNTNCPKHGDIGMVFKCMFCCNAAGFVTPCKHYVCFSCLKKWGSFNVNDFYQECDGHCSFAPHPHNKNNELIGYCVLCEDEMEKEILSQSHENHNSNKVVICPKCNQSFSIDKQKNQNVIKNRDKYRNDAFECFCNNNATCPACKTNFCSNCKRIPFHDEITCDEQNLLDKKIFCRFCTIYPPTCGDSEKANKRVCWHEECKECLKDSCMHICDCGHACCGIHDEKQHFGCSICNPNVQNCTICMRSCTESPSILMKCGHPVHKSCLINFYLSLDMKNRLIIPRCNYHHECQEIPYHECVKEEAEKWIIIEKKINEITKLQMKIENTNEEEHVKNPDDKDYYNQPEKYARDFFLFYLCDKCKQPFYSGHKNCGEEGEKGKHECIKCRKNLMRSNCPKHGELGMVFKCMYCCNNALWISFGNYYCDRCHKNYSSILHNEFCPECDGHCNFAPHPHNSKHELIGYCALCENEKENSTQSQEKNDSNIIQFILNEKPLLNSVDICIDKDDKKHFYINLYQINESYTSKIYKIVDKQSNFPMCKKIIKENLQLDEIQKIMNHFKNIYSITHPCICNTIAINPFEKIEFYNDNLEIQETKTVALFMEFLTYRLENVLMMNIDNTLKTRIVLDVAHAMNHIHKNGIIHKNLTIDNIMLNSFFETKLINTSLNQFKESIFGSFDSKKKSYINDVKNFAFMSPEIIKQKYDYKTDVYSFGVILHVIFVGCLPEQNLKDKLEGKSINLTQISKLVSPFCIKLIKDCLSYSPSNRPSFEEIINLMRENAYQLTTDVDPSFLSRRDNELKLYEDNH